MNDWLPPKQEGALASSISCTKKKEEEMAMHQANFNFKLYGQYSFAVSNGPMSKIGRVCFPKF